VNARLRTEAEREAARLPALLAQALPLAAAVRAGAHPRRREGAGEQFWSYRPYRPGDEPRRIDWRRSARGDEVLVREQEQARAATVLVWPDRRPGMRWRSDASLPLKSERAAVLALALASLLGRGGERVGLLGVGRPVPGVQAAERLAEALAIAPEDAPPEAIGHRGARVLITDALEPAKVWGERLAGVQSGILLRVHDPAEVDPPYKGRTLFAPPAGLGERLFGRAEAVREAYAGVLRAHTAEVDAAFARAGFRVLEHRTDRPAATALLALWRAVAGEG
jgi:uncharacterized protein (DUF58 family)